MKLEAGRSFGGALTLVVASVLVASSLVGCGKTEEKGTMERAGAAADKAVEKARDATVEAAKSFGAAAEKAADKAVDATKEAVDKATAATRDAAAGAAKAASTAVAPKK